MVHRGARNATEGVPYSVRTIIVPHHAARLATAALLALVVRAALGQQPYPMVPRGDPYAQQPQSDPPAYQPAQAQWQQPAPNQALRYPLPTAPSLPPVVPASAIRAAQNPSVPAAPPTAPLAPPAWTPPPQAVLFAPGHIVAGVGDKSILYCDVAPTVNLIMAPVLAKAKSEAEREALESQREMLTKNVIQQVVQNKMLLAEFESTMPKEMKNDAKKRAEAEGKLKKNIRNAFDGALNSAREKVATASQEDIEKMMKQDASIVRLALLMKEKHLESQGELDVALRQFGTSVEQQARDYGEYMLGIEAARTKIKSLKTPPTVSLLEMLDYYREHQADYYIPAKARFEILTAKFSRFAGDRQATWNHIAMMGDEVLLGGIPFPAAARKHSQEPRASDGGYYDWVTPGSLASKPIDQAVFSLEVDKLS